MLHKRPRETPHLGEFRQRRSVSVYVNVFISTFSECSCHRQSRDVQLAPVGFDPLRYAIFKTISNPDALCSDSSQFPLLATYLHLYVTFSCSNHARRMLFCFYQPLNNYKMMLTAYFRAQIVYNTRTFLFYGLRLLQPLLWTLCR